MYKKRQVVFIKGTEEAKIGELLISGNGTMFVANCDPINARPTYVYVVSTDTIKVGDWFLNDDRDSVRANDGKPIWVLYKCTSIENGWLYGNNFQGIGHNPDWSRKVIASNNPELHKGWIRDEDPKREYPDYVMITTMRGIPKLSDSFIQEFIHRYNIKHPMDDIMVEYGFTIDKSLGHFHQERRYFLKINPDDTVNTKEEQRTWTRAEVTEIARQAFNQGEMNEGCTASYMSFDDLIEELI